ncbi:flagellar hook-basal body complex protein FliE [Desulfosporosinus sp. FKB]|uniref:flagellar hook-basal body complex protein FliE n=1 Tax=Desulfosporosinus sp. FKB TaxID=1969835 RepID=UPI000B4A48C6|nr:flagellar hook-basal body complex protein FliE [Desulfosporosinus sp. FKB]
MSISIAPISSPGILNPISSASTENKTALPLGDGAQKAGTDFAKFLNDALGQVNALQDNADKASLQLASGQIQDVSTAMVALEKANLSLSLTVQVRDKVLDAYHQIMQMQM